MSAALASGLLYDMDEVGGPNALQGTHRNHAGKLTGRVIDYMLATRDFFLFLAIKPKVLPTMI